MSEKSEEEVFQRKTCFSGVRLDIEWEGSPGQHKEQNEDKRVFSWGFCLWKNVERWWDVGCEGVIL